MGREEEGNERAREVNVVIVVVFLRVVERVARLGDASSSDDAFCALSLLSPLLPKNKNHRAISLRKTHHEHNPLPTPDVPFSPPH